MTGFDPASAADHERLRAELGYAADERVCVVTVGGSGVGADLLRRAIDAFPDAKARVPELRWWSSPGRESTRRAPGRAGLEVCGYVADLTAISPRATSPSFMAGWRRRWS